jgi:cyanophycin synthetase
MREARGAFYLRAWDRAADSVGARFSLLSDTVGEISRDERRLRVAENTTSLDDPVSLQLAGDKPAVYALLSRLGIPVPPHRMIGRADRRDLARHLRSLTPPLVVKPAAGTGAGDGVSTGVATLGRLRHAVAWALAFAPRALIEEQIDGDCYRVLILDGEVLDTVLRRPSCVVGDGSSTIRALVDAENFRRLAAGADRAQALLRRDPDLVATLAAQGLSPRSRPERGRRVTLKRVINDNRAEENEPANGRLCVSILEAARRAAQAVGLRLAGVDLICRDPTVPLERSGGKIIEVNATPGFYYHYHRLGTAFPVADHLLRKFFAAGAAS